jgi:hypothetical protein
MDPPKQQLATASNKLLLLLYEAILPFHRCSGGHLHMNFHTGAEKPLFFFVDKVS